MISDNLTRPEYKECTSLFWEVQLQNQQLLKGINLVQIKHYKGY